MKIGRLSGFPAFGLVWVGQLVSLLGSGLSGFALGVWVYQETGSVTRFTIIFMTNTLPGLLMSPIAGSLIDRWDRRWAMILSDTGAALSTVTIAALFLTGHLELWHIYLCTAFASFCNAFQWPAYSAAISLMVPKKHLGRAGGMTEFSEAVAQLIAPVLGGVLLGVIGLQGILVIDFATFLIALVTLSLVRMPRPEPGGGEKKEKKSILRESVYGWTYIRRRPGLLGLLVLAIFVRFRVGVVNVLATPLVLAFTTPAVLGTVLSIGGSGMLIGSLVMMVWGGPKRLMHGVLGFHALSGIGLLLAGFQPSVVLFAVAAFVYFFSLPISNSCSQALWQRKVDPSVQGRVFAIRRLVGWSALPLAYLVAGPLSDYVFEPALAPGGALAGTAGRLLGVGEGRGIALLFVIMGGFSLLLSAVGMLHPRLRRIEDELLDTLPSDSKEKRDEPEIAPAALEPST